MMLTLFISISNFIACLCLRLLRTVIYDAKGRIYMDEFVAYNEENFIVYFILCSVVFCRLFYGTE